MIMCIVLAYSSFAENSEEESIDWLGKESFLCLLTILVHGFTDQIERSDSVFQIAIFLVMLVAEQQ